MTIDHTHNPDARCWVEGADAHPEFPVQNLPLGIFAPRGGAPRAGTAIGTRILDLAALVRLLPEAVRAAVAEPVLNALFALPCETRLSLRHALFALLTDEAHRPGIEPHFHRAFDCELHLPFSIGDYTDFYVGIHHATNIGRLFRPDNPLLPNYKYVPIGYHGRASSVRVSGTAVHRPSGQRRPPDADAPEYGPTRRLDYELELGIWIAGENALGSPVPIGEAGRRVAGLCLLNDWSARDIQAWEYQPLGPFLAKSFLTTVSPWIVTAEALEPLRMKQPPRTESDPPPLPYLMDEADQSSGAFSLILDVHLRTSRMRGGKVPPVRLATGEASSLYWTVAQMITHHTSNGCNLMPGDLLGSGTISGPHAGSEGSLMELSRAGQDPVLLPTGETRSFLEDGDEITLSAFARAEGFRTIGFGPCVGTVVGGASA